MVSDTTTAQGSTIASKTFAWHADGTMVRSTTDAHTQNPHTLTYRYEPTSGTRISMHDGNKTVIFPSSQYERTREGSTDTNKTKRLFVNGILTATITGNNEDIFLNHTDHLTGTTTVTDVF